MLASEEFYQEELIPKDPARMTQRLPDQYREMRRLVRCCSCTTTRSEAELFYRQARWMEAFEDDCPYDGEFHRYFPSYQAMNDRQLRGYFTWRTRLRRGEIEAAPETFARLYLYELLNGIGWKQPEEGFRLLKEFRSAWIPIRPDIDRSLPRWMQDFLVYYNLDRRFLKEIPSDSGPELPVLTLMKGESATDEEIFSALNALLPHPPEESPFYRKNPEVLKKAALRVFREVMKRSRSKSPEKPPFGELGTIRYHMFGSAVFHDHLKREEFCYEINALHRYRCTNGEWSVERFFLREDKIRRLDSLLRALDGQMRKQFSFSPLRKEEPLSPGDRKLLDKVIGSVLEEKKREEAPKIRIDLSRLGTIRRDAEEICGRLIVELPDESPAPPPPESEETMETPHFSASIPSREPPPEQKTSEKEQQTGKTEKSIPACLDRTEREFLRCLISGKEWKELLRTEHRTLAMVVDSVNEKLFDYFNDTAVIFHDDTPELPDEYAEELKGEIGS